MKYHFGRPTLGLFLHDKCPHTYPIVIGSAEDIPSVAAWGLKLCGRGPYRFWHGKGGNAGAKNILQRHGERKCMETGPDGDERLCNGDGSEKERVAPPDTATYYDVEFLNFCSNTPRSGLQFTVASAPAHTARR